jgi:hypothetical protein
MTAGTGQLARDSREKTAETGLPGQDNLERTARTGQPEGTVGEARAGGRGQDGHITVRTRQLEQGNREGTTAAVTGHSADDTWDRTAGTGWSVQNSLAAHHGHDRSFDGQGNRIWISRQNSLQPKQESQNIIE